MGIEDIIISLIPAEYLAWFAFGVIVASGALPVLQLIANKTANKWDNAAVARLEWLLAQLPRLRRGDVQRAQDAIIRASVKPPHFTDLMIVFVVLPLLGCAGTPAQDTALMARLNANRFRETVNASSDDVAATRPYIELGCKVLGPESSECKVASRAYNTAAFAIDAAHSAIDLYERVGFGAAEVEAAIKEVQNSTSALAGVLTTAKEAVHGIVAKQAGRPGGGPDGASAQQPPEASGPAPEGGSPTPAAP